MVRPIGEYIRYMATPPALVGELLCINKQEWQYGTVRYVGTVRYASIFAKKYGTLIRYAFFVMVRVRYVGMLFKFKIPNFSHIAPDFCMQR